MSNSLCRAKHGGSVTNKQEAVPSRAYYQQQARSCFDMATMSRDPVARDRWIARANEYLMLADNMGDESMPELPRERPAEQAQAQQQHQQKKQDES